MVERVTVSGEIHSVFKARANVQGVVVAPSALEATSTRAETIQVQASSAAASNNPCQPENLPFPLIHQPCLGMHALFHKTLRLPSRRLFEYGLYNQYGISYRRFHSALASRSYDEAVGFLNTLQTPFVVLKKQIEAGIKPDETTNEEMRKYLDKIGYSQQDLDKLNIIHVAGTKGKGSTCAFVDSILSQYRKSHDIPRNVGLFTSPHLVAVRERIRINSVPISRDLFAKYFFEVWDKLEAAAAKSEVTLVKPVYFRYLTLMSYHVFLQEGVDAAVYEVGIGGQYDSTNVVENPAVTGISTLGIDHVFALGNTIEKIAWHKGGIQKKGAPSFTVKQSPGALAVVQGRAEETKVKTLTILDEDSRLAAVKIRPDAAFQRLNASLAIKLAETSLQKLDPKFEICPTLPKEFVDGLEQVVWRGRCELKKEGNVTWYLDGAHTQDSIMVATNWFVGESFQKPGTRVLIFNQQGHREAIALLEELFRAVKSQESLHFDHVIFCPTIPSDKLGRPDSINLYTDSAILAGLELQRKFAKKWEELNPSSATFVKVLPSVEDAVDYVRSLTLKAQREKEVHAFITGSVHLVGRTLGVLEGAEAL